MEAVILAGGLGTRLRPAVKDLPKCMAPICGKPFLHYVLAHLRRSGCIDRVILSLGYKQEVVVEWIQSLKGFPFEYVFSIEEEPLGTGGAVKKALPHVMGTDVMILNGDTLFDIDMERFIGEHVHRTSILSIALKPVKDVARYGNVVMDEKARITGFQEKGYCQEGLINGGIYLMKNDKELLSGFPDRFSYETDFLQRQGGREGFYGLVQDVFFIDIGVPEDYRKANNELENVFG
jgi:D-glycero-alpha-D-manno-heptose 1-phosphate guanylyltransferase